MTDKKIIIAKISAAHGIKGYVKLVSFFENPSDIANYKNKIFDEQGNFYNFQIISNLQGKGGDGWYLQDY